MTKNKLKKNAKYGLLLLVLGLFALNYINLTGAKYKTTSPTVTESARVAKWISGTDVSLDLFSASYIADDSALSGKNSVKSVDDAKVIAPGTSGSYQFSPAIQGNAPEVAYQVKFDVTGSYTGDWTVNSAAYEPLRFSVVKVVDETNTTLVTDVSLAEMLTALNTAGASTTYEANQLLPVETIYTISWEWPYSVNEATDEKDTELANKLANGDLFIELAAKLTVEQID